MKLFLNSVINDKNVAGIKYLAERYMIDYYVNEKNYDDAITVANDIIQKTEDSDLKTDVLYAKGLILSHDLNKTKEAADCFNNIIKNYPESALSSFASNELSILGFTEAGKVTKFSSIRDKEFQTNNYPNPFNPTTIINYTLPSDEYVTLKIFDVLGSEITTLVNEHKKAGRHTVSFDGSNLSSGIYFYTITAGSNSISKKIILAK